MEPGADGSPRTDGPPRCGGFTLIELMIVTVIVGLLAGLAIPEFDGVRQRAYNTSALADLNNANLKAYTTAMAEVAAKQQVAFADVFTPTREAFEDPKTDLTFATAAL